MQLKAETTNKKRHRDSERLQFLQLYGTKGFNSISTLCTSKWKKTHKIPGGTHEYIEVIAFTQVRRKKVVFLVELGFADEFRVVKACNGTISDQCVARNLCRNLNAIVRVVCEAAKKSAEEKKIHMGPWRRRDFMQMKWSASSERRQRLDYPTSDSLNVVTSPVEVT